MDRTLKVVEFIKEHPEDWEKILSAPPYSITVTRGEKCGYDLVMLKYNMIEDPDFSNPIVRECRGLILMDKTFEPVTVPFFKFGNYGESYCPDIDWKTASVLQKIDGSLIKVVRLGEGLLVSTNGTIDAYDAPVADQVGCPHLNFGGIAVEQLKEKLGSDDITCFFDPGITYMFELVSPWTRVVVPWEHDDLYFLGTRDNKTLQEQLPYGHPFADLFKTPKRTNLGSIEECVKATQDMPWDEEGYVVVDSNFNRVKVKSPAYVAIHHMKGEGPLTYRTALELVRMQQDDDYLAYFPELSDKVHLVKDKFLGLVNMVDSFWKESGERVRSMESRKDQAQAIITALGKQSGAGFALLDGKVQSSMEFYMGVTTVYLLRSLGWKE